MNGSFTESQKFNKSWHYLLAAAPLVIVLITFCLIRFDIVTTKDGKKDSGLFFAIITGTAFIFIGFLFLKLKTQINQDGISVTFIGFPFSKKFIKWEEIQSVSVITYSPLSDYGGWGVRYSMTGNGWCYNVSGNTGIKIVYQNGKQFLIGTQQQEEAKKIIDLYYKN